MWKWTYTRPGWGKFSLQRSRGFPEILMGVREMQQKGGTQAVLLTLVALDV